MCCATVPQQSSPSGLPGQNSPIGLPGDTERSHTHSNGPEPLFTAGEFHSIQKFKRFKRSADLLHLFPFLSPAFLLLSPSFAQLPDVLLYYSHRTTVTPTSQAVQLRQTSRQADILLHSQSTQQRSKHSSTATQEEKADKDQAGGCGKGSCFAGAARAGAVITPEQKLERNDMRMLFSADGLWRECKVGQLAAMGSVGSG